ncbi:hypothetical protein HanPI659440_Chr11g0427081 [Helianthus annuus]|nr:hypothetical protein HanPI659440_Chr11g0427081 [Helianthus annuus]
MKWLRHVSNHVSGSPNRLLKYTFRIQIPEERKKLRKREGLLERDRDRRERRSRLLAGLRRQQRWLNDPNDGGFN